MTGVSVLLCFYLLIEGEDDHDFTPSAQPTTDANGSATVEGHNDDQHDLTSTAQPTSSQSESTTLQVVSDDQADSTSTAQSTSSQSGPRILQELNGDQHAPPTTSQVNTDQDDSTATTAQPTTHLNGPTTLQLSRCACRPDGPPLTCGAMRHHWLLIGVCGWVLFFLIFGSRFISLSHRAADDYVGKPETQSWTASSTKNVKPPAVPEWGKRTPLPGYQSSAAPSPADPVNWHSVVTRRLELLQSFCANSTLRNLTHTPLSKFVLDRIFVCDKQKILFCQTPKVGNTQWKKVLIVLNGAFPTVNEIPENVVHDHEKNGLPRLSSFSEKEISKRLSAYFKFFIVRDPFERLISAFKDKFLQNPRFEPWYKHDIAPAIIRKYRRGRTSSSDSAPGLRFEDFVRYLGDPGHQHLDRIFGDHIIHWMTYVELCAPCDIIYDVVGHHETLERDAPYILQAAGIDRLVSYPAIPPGITRYNRTKVERYFSGISKRDVRRLFARFQGDFVLFGYKRPDFLLE
ncbi:carbohydrate sulfotransferase 10 [Arapaima gigas]